MMKHTLKTLLMSLGLVAASTAAGYTADVPMMDSDATTTTILAGGCFWCLEHDLKKVPGVIKAESGYAGGDRPNPTYHDYHDLDATYKVPHIEVVEVTYQPAKLSYEQLLHTYLRKVDPTDNGGQFCDRGPAYRPAIFVANDAERAAAEAALKDAEATIKQTVKVDILPTATFWPAEDYHQDYAEKNPTRYNFYRWKCGRDARVDAVWGK